jgi:hypothetical protein
VISKNNDNTQQLPRDQWQSPSGSGMPASANAPPSVGDQTSGGEQQLRELLQDLGLEPEVIEAVCRAVRDNTGAVDEPPDNPTGMQPPTGGTMTPKKNGAQDAQLYGSEIGVDTYGFDPITNAMTAERIEAKEYAKLLRGMVAMDGKPLSEDAQLRIVRKTRAREIGSTYDQFASDPFCGAKGGAARIGIV